MELVIQQIFFSGEGIVKIIKVLLIVFFIIILVQIILSFRDGNPSVKNNSTSIESYTN